MRRERDGERISFEMEDHVEDDRKTIKTIERPCMTIEIRSKNDRKTTSYLNIVLIR